MKRTILGVALAALLAVPGMAGAQDFPTRPMTMVIPFAAGGPTDLLGRVIAAKMGEILKQNVIVENVGGAGGQTGSKRVAEAKPDGYSFVLGTVGTHAQGQTLYKHPLYNAETDFTPVGLIAEVPIVLIARKDLPANNLKEFVAYATANAAKMTFGSAGAGSAIHLGCVVLNLAMGLTVTHVPYRGAAPALSDLQGGQIDYMCVTAVPQIEAKLVKPIASLTLTRIPQLPDLPTAREQGFENMESYSWIALFLPKGAPAQLVATLNRATSRAMDAAWVRDRVEAIGGTLVAPERRTPQYLAGFVRTEIDKWAVPIRAAGVTAD